MRPPYYIQNIYMQVGKAKFVTITDAEFTALCDKWHTNAHVAKCENHVMQDIGRFVETRLKFFGPKVPLLSFFQVSSSY